MISGNLCFRRECPIAVLWPIYCDLFTVTHILCLYYLWDGINTTLLTNPSHLKYSRHALSQLKWKEELDLCSKDWEKKKKTLLKLPLCATWPLWIQWTDNVTAAFHWLTGLIRTCNQWWNNRHALFFPSSHTRRAQKWQTVPSLEVLNI